LQTNIDDYDLKCHLVPLDAPLKNFGLVFLAEICPYYTINILFQKSSVIYISFLAKGQVKMALVLIICNFYYFYFEIEESSKFD